MCVVSWAQITDVLNVGLWIGFFCGTPPVHNHHEQKQSGEDVVMHVAEVVACDQRKACTCSRTLRACENVTSIIGPSDVSFGFVTCTSTLSYAVALDSVNDDP